MVLDLPLAGTTHELAGGNTDETRVGEGGA
jgi:hypothetical protein